MVKVGSNNRIDVAMAFIQEGDRFLGSAQCLFRANVCFMSQAAVFCHQGIELILKGYLIWKVSEYPQKHKLLDIVNQMSFLNPPQEYLNLLAKIDTFYFYRYPIDDHSFDRIEKILLSIKDETDGIQNLPGEIGTDDWEKVYKFYRYLVNSMPVALIEKYNDLGATIEAS